MKFALGLLFVGISTFTAAQVGGGGLGGPPGGGGSPGGGAGGTIITAEQKLSEVYVRPIYDAAIPAWRQQTILHTKENGIETWYLDGDLLPPNLAPAIPTGWTQAPPGSTGYAESTLTTKFKIKLPIEEAGKKIWVKITSSAVASGGGTGSRVLTATNGQGDAPLDSGEEMTSHGAHLRKVSINEQGEGEWTVSMKAKSVGTGSQYSYTVSTGANLARDPRSISLPTMYKKKPGEANVWYPQSYMALDGEFLSNGGQPYGWVPKKKVEPFGITYTTATREVIEPVSTDALSLKLNAKLALPPAVIKGEWQYVWVDGPGGGHFVNQWVKVGNREKDFSFWASFFGADYTMRPVQESGTHDNASFSDTHFLGDSCTISIAANKVVDTLDYYSPIAPGDPARIQGDSSGSFKAKFSFNDGVTAEAEATLVYFPSVISSEAKTMPFCFNPSLEVADVFTFGTDWSNSENIDASVPGLGANGYQDQVMLANGIVSVLALIAAAAEWPALAIPLSAMEILGSSALDSSHDFGATARSLNRWTPSSTTDTGEFWSVEGLPSIYPSTESWLTAVKASRWRVVCAPYSKLTLHARDFYDTTGFVKRAPAHFWETTGAGQCGNDWKKWYIFKYGSPKGTSAGGQ